MVVSNEGYEDEDHEEDEYSLREVMELVKSLYAKLERLEFGESAEDIPVLEAHVIGSSTKDDNEDFIVVEALVSTPNETFVSDLKEESIVEEDCSLFLHEISHYVFTFGIEKKDREIIPFLQNGGVLCSPTFDNYSNEE
jgi:hypothetical protein